jgi:branched-chain amino acid transport system substrate-binding protein
MRLLVVLTWWLLIAGAAIADDTRPIRIGFLTDLNGPHTDNDGKASIESARMAIADFGGKVLGRPVELLVGDHQNKVDVGLAVARRWYETQDVDAVMDVNNSGIALAVSNLTREKNKILLVTSASSADLTGKACTPNLVHWLPDTHSLAYNVAAAETQLGAKTWYIMAVDYAYGHSMQEEATKAIEQNGGKVLGTVRHPINSSDFSSYLLQAQSSGAEVLALANAATDLVNSIKQAREFEIKMRIVAIPVYILDVPAVGQDKTAGLRFVDVFYWGLNEKTRQWSKRFFAFAKHMPTTPQADAYRAVIHYLRAIQAAGTMDTSAVMGKMKELPLEDETGSIGYVRADGRVIRDMYMFEIKSPAESKYPWDYYKVIKTFPGETAYVPLSESKCPLVAAKR